MEIKRDDPARRKSFRARHNCSDRLQIQSKVLELFSMESISKGGQLMKNFKEFITEKSVPNDPKLWSRAKALAKQKFDVYPSAYANGWAAKWYKSKGGTWRSG